MSDKGPDRFNQLRRIIEHAARLLPAQGPITAFVHHNTLHALEHLPFEEAVVEGGQIFGCHPFLPEHRYRDKLLQGRIRREDIEAVLLDDLADRADELLGFLGTRFHFRFAMLAHRWRTGPAAELRWVVAETNALRRFRDETPQPVRDRVLQATRSWIMRELRNEPMPPEANRRLHGLIGLLCERFDVHRVENWNSGTWEAFCLHALWLVCRDGVERNAPPLQMRSLPIRHRDLFVEAVGGDSDQLVHDNLIRYCAAFLDQGLAHWSLPRRDGFYGSFVALYRRAGGPPDRWLWRLPHELARIEALSLSPLESIAESLELLGVPDGEHEAFITESLLALRGYAGMIWQAESRGDRIARPAAA